MKTILITGATAGIGRHAALELARQGHHVIATGRRENALETLRVEAQGLKGVVDVIRMDVTDEDSVFLAADRIAMLTDGRGVDVLVNNAGYGQMGPLEEVTDKELRKQYDTNVFGLMNVTRAFLPQMRMRGEGRIINVGSIGGRVTFPLMGAYNSTKYAVESLSDAMRNELAAFGIKVSLVEPGPIRTEFNDVAMDTIDKNKLNATAYSAVIARATEYQRKFESRSAGPEVTTKAIVHAALAKRPRIRYVVPFSSSVMLAFMSVLPTRVLDAIFRLATGLTPKVLASSTPVSTRPPALASSAKQAKAA